MWLQQIITLKLFVTMRCMVEITARTSGWRPGKLLLTLSVTMAIALVVLALQSRPAYALDDSYTYAGLDVNYTNMKALGVTYNPINLRAKLGVLLMPDIIPALAFESQFGIDATDDTNTFNGTDVTLGINYYIGFYLRASFDVADFASIYGLLGMSAAQLNGDTIFLEDDTESGFSYGLGFTFGLPFDIDGSIEVMQLVNGNAFDIYMASIGASYKF